MDCILTYHTNIKACGVAKFNTLMAQKLNIPILQIFNPKALSYLSPCISIKASEFTSEDAERIKKISVEWISRGGYSLFLHDYLSVDWENNLIKGAKVVYAASHEISAKIKSIRPNHQTLWAPPMLTDLRLHHNADITLFSFGMAHKIQVKQYHYLKKLLAQSDKQSEKRYRIFLSTAIHEGQSFEDSFDAAFCELEQIFPGQVYFLGFLSDSATFNCIQHSNYFVAFFPKGARENNTSIHAAMMYGAVVITNLDDKSPKEFVHGKNLLDINQLETLPLDKTILKKISEEAINTSLQFSWSALISEVVKIEGEGIEVGGNPLLKGA